MLGLCCSHNGSACLLHGDEIVAAVQDERILRYKRQETTARFINRCVKYCLDAGGIRLQDLDLIVYSIMRGAGPAVGDDIFLNECLRAAVSKVPVVSVPHHYAHAVSAFATSGFRRSAVLVIDGGGTLFERLPPQEQAVAMNPEAGAGFSEWLSYYEAEGTTLTPVFKQLSRCHLYLRRTCEEFGSLGDMYAAVGACLFGSIAEGPGKVMGLAPYGKPTIPVEKWLAIDDNGLIDFKLEAFREVNGRCRWPADFDACADLAASVQQAAEHALMDVVRRIRSRSSSAHLCYAGGVALNSVANERIVRDGGFDEVFIFPAAEDSGVAVGAAYHGLWQLTHTNTCRRLRRDAMGRRYGRDQVEQAVTAMPGLTTRRLADQPSDVVRLLCDGKMVGWFAGGSELGPRSLGQRTILCDPRRPEAKDVLNGRVKHREPFRPFAPVVLQDRVEEWFDVPARWVESPFMLRVWPFRPGQAARVPAVAHVDGTARVQTITRDTHPALSAVVEAFAAATGIPMLLNTSFNVAGEPIVETPEDALLCLLRTGLDCCVFADTNEVVSKRREFRTILDLCPEVRATSISVEMPVSNGRIVTLDDEPLQPLRDRWHLKPYEPDEGRQLLARYLAKGHVTHGVAHALVETRWGDAAVVLTDEHLKLLKMMDGKTDGHTLVESEGGWNEAWVERALAGLCGASVIRLRDVNGAV